MTSQASTVNFTTIKRPRIIFVGSLAQMYKGPDVLLKAVRFLMPELDPRVVIIGDGKRPA